ncbi:hypothetical protein BAE44_0020378 [Dichanthelium oligosanthes]|uniref:Uncharacterized protein n=1 Tax=Dichanthelium oligosanthes TaxID=888268 RepID=A0A1E5V0B6_9POAL|nr:hypothetical protein BAE44_0020378 [Dichanthelium oligosanthes]
MYPHVLGPGGYAKKLPKWETREQELTLAGVVPATSMLAPRSKHFLLARGASLSDDGSLNFKNKTAAEMREEDELTHALSTKEHPGRARGIGVVPWKAAFSEDTAIYRKSKHTRQLTLLDARVDARVQQLVEERMKEWQEVWKKSFEELERWFMKQREEEVLTSQGPQL